MMRFVIYFKYKNPIKAFFFIEFNFLDMFVAFNCAKVYIYLTKNEITCFSLCTLQVALNKYYAQF